jgi:dCMP deaminase
MTLRTKRASRHQSFMDVAIALSEQSTCARRAVGCVLTDKHHRIIGSGYNGVPAGVKHCIEEPCGGQDFPSGLGLDMCCAIHAEQNALMQCADVKAIVVAYCTTFPCIHCVKLLMNTTCEAIYYNHDYPSPSLQAWLGSGRHAAKMSVVDGHAGYVIQQHMPRG